jgi:hypothetical protein
VIEKEKEINATLVQKKEEMSHFYGVSKDVINDHMESSMESSDTAGLLSSC